MLFRSVLIGFLAILVIHADLVGADPTPQTDLVGADPAPQAGFVGPAPATSQDNDTADTDPSADNNAADTDPSADNDVADTDPSEDNDTADADPLADDGAADTDPLADNESVDADPLADNLIDDTQGYAAAPLPPEYAINPNGSVTLRICFNWSCHIRQTITFTSDDMDLLKRLMAKCLGPSLHNRLQRIRIGIWQMELLAQKYQPLLANDRAINDFEENVDGRTDCVDNTSNTTTYLHILRDIGELTGWTISSPKVRNRLDVTAVHWTAVVTDTDNGQPWSIDSWYRPNGHLPTVMPLRSWINEEKGWEPPFDHVNFIPHTIYELCTKQ